MKAITAMTVLTFSISLSAHAIPVKNLVPRAPSNVPASGFKMDVRIGEKNTQFIVWSDKKGKYFSGSDGVNTKSSKLTDKNFKFLVGESDKILKTKSVSANTCPRSVITLAAKSGKTTQAACIEATNDTSKRMKGLANLMQLLI